MSQESGHIQRPSCLLTLCFLEKVWETWIGRHVWGEPGLRVAQGSLICSVSEHLIQSFLLQQAHREQLSYITEPLFMNIGLHISSTCHRLVGLQPLSYVLTDYRVGVVLNIILAGHTYEQILVQREVLTCFLILFLSIREVTHNLILYLFKKYFTYFIQVKYYIISANIPDISHFDGMFYTRMS